MEESPKNKRKTFWDLSYTYFVEFSNNTSIHGFKYLVENKRFLVERLWWLIVLCVCIYTCVNLVFIILKKREENPVFLTISQNPKHLWDIPFPAVTVCSEVRIKRTKYDYKYYKQKISNLTDEELQTFLNVRMFCQDGSPVDQKVNLSVDVRTIDDLIELAPTSNDVIWYSVPEFSSLYSPMLTNLGLCYTYNMVDRKELYTNFTFVHKNLGKHRPTRLWTFDNNYKKTKNDTIPTRAKSTNFYYLVHLHTFEHEEDAACNLYRGYKIILHHPADTPLLSKRVIPISVDTLYNIWIKPEVTTTSSDLRKYEPRKRNCYFSDEKQLKFYQIYSQLNCRIECIANYTLQKCECVPFYMPHEKSTRICSYIDRLCALKAERYLLEMEMDVDISESENQNMFKICDCLPSCNSITYNTEISQTKVPYSFDGETNSKIVFSYKDNEVSTIERKELFSNTDFWASCGGLLSLFTGFSVISLAEIVYFLSLRLVCNMWRFGKEVFEKNNANKCNLRKTF